MKDVSGEHGEKKIGEIATKEKCEQRKLWTKKMQNTHQNKYTKMKSSAQKRRWMACE